MPALPTGLVRHKNGVYYLRRRIPQDLLSYYPKKKEESKSLGVSSYRDAVERFYIEDAKLQNQWRRIRQQHAEFAAARQIETFEILSQLSQEDIDRISQHVEAVALAGDERRREEGQYDISDIEEYKVSYSAALPELKAAVAVGNVEVLAPLLTQFLSLYRYDNRLSESDFRRLALAYGRAAIKSNEKLLRRYEGEHVPTPRIATIEQKRLSVVVSDYVKAYEDSDKPAMARKVKFVLPMFLESVGDKPLSAIRQSDINRFFELVHTLVPRWSDIARQKKMTWMQVSKLGFGEIAPGTFNDTYKAVIRRFLKWAITNWQDQGFPTTLTTELIEYGGSRKEGENHQRAFKLGELKRLFSGSEMRRFAEDLDGQHQFWLPHVGLFTGARVNELCQINPLQDICRDEESKLWYFQITEDTDSDEQVVKSVKTGSSIRRVPIHSALIKLGFLDYVKAQQKKRTKLLFSPFKPSRGRASGEAEKWFRKFLGELGIRDETPGAKLTGMHAFRSTFLNRAMNLDVARAEVITGHAHKAGKSAPRSDEEVSSVVRTYQGEMEVAAKSRILERIQWPDLELVKPKKPIV